MLKLIIIFEQVLKETDLYYRTEKEKIQYYTELNDLRATLDHLSNEKVCKAF